MPDDITSTDSLNNTTSAVTSLTDALKAAGLSSTAIQQIIDKVSISFTKLTGVGKDAASSLSTFGQISKLTATMTDDLGQGAGRATSFFEKFKDMSLQSASAFNLMAAALLGPSQLLRGIATDNSMTSFSASIKNVIDDTKGLAGPLGAVAKMMGVNFLDAAGIARPLDEIKREVINLGAAIDEHVNFQRAIFNMSAQTGQLNSLYAQTGDGLQNLGNVTKDYEDKLSNVSKATHTNMEQAGAYFASLSKLPPCLLYTS